MKNGPANCGRDDFTMRMQCLGQLKLRCHNDFEHNQIISETTTCSLPAMCPACLREFELFVGSSKADIVMRIISPVVASSQTFSCSFAIASRHGRLYTMRSTH